MIRRKKLFDDLFTSLLKERFRPPFHFGTNSIEHAADARSIVFVHCRAEVSQFLLTEGGGV